MTSSAARRASLAAASLWALTAASAHATDGYFLNGVGARAEGEAGVALALPQDALSIAANPASATEVGNRLDIGADIFTSNRRASISGNGAGLNGSTSGNGANPFLLPNFGYVRPLSDRLAVGVAVYGNGGMNTVYNTNPFASFHASGPAGVDLKQIFVTPTLAVRLGGGQSIGVSPLLVLQGFRATGIQPFGQASADPSHFTNQGVDWSTGAGVRVGWLGHFGPAVTLGAFYQSKVWASRFGKYAGLFAGQGGFDVPSSWGGGVAVKAAPALTLAADVKRIDYAGVAAIGDGLAPLLSNVPFGASGGPGFGWRNITVYKLGLSYAASPHWTLRTGYGHAGNPIPASQTLLNILAPGVVQDHLTAGATWISLSGLDVSGFVLHALKHTVNGSGSIPANYGGGEAGISLAETSVGLSAGALRLLTGRIAGISGILRSALRGPERGWQASFLAGLLVAGGLAAAVNDAGLAAGLEATSLPRLVIAGLLVGVGTGLGNGCTSGHGICGLARFSPRSLCAVATFMGSAMLTVFVLRHGAAW